jgi:hypothetical protein
MEIFRYTPADRAEWDAFVDASRNGTFLFRRGFMDYHADRFADRSLLFRDRGRLIAILPANERDGVLYSHQGLTYGSLLLADDTRAAQVGEAFDALVGYLRAEGFAKLVYKPVPSFYHRLPSHEDIYFLFRHGAERTACALASTVNLREPLPAHTRERDRALQRALKAGVEVRATDALAPFWAVMEANMMSRFGVRPVHTVDEMALLRSRFPDKIRLFCAMQGDELLGGALLFDTGRVIRVQYAHASPRGKQLGAVDLIYTRLIDAYAPTHLWFDFGQCTEEDGRVLNEGLIHYKEGFGGRGTLYETYTLTI